MNKSVMTRWGLVLGLALTLPAYGQDAAEAPADPAAAADAPAATDSSAAPADASSTEAAASDSASGDAAAGSTAEAGEQSVAVSEDSESSGSHQGFPLYVGADYAFLTAALSKDKLKNTLGGGDSYDSNFYRLRVGTRLLEAIGLEANYGIKGSGSDDVDTDQMYGLYVVPTGVVFEILEVSTPVGYSHLEIKNSAGKLKFDGVSFGVNFEVPVFVREGSAIPAIRLGGGGTVYYAGGEARVYGFQAGLRMDFKL